MEGQSKGDLEARTKPGAECDRPGTEQQEENRCGSSTEVHNVYKLTTAGAAADLLQQMKRESE